LKKEKRELRAVSTKETAGILHEESADLKNLQNRITQGESQALQKRGDLILKSERKKEGTRGRMPVVKEVRDR